MRQKLLIGIIFFAYLILLIGAAEADPTVLVETNLTLDPPNEITLPVSSTMELKWRITNTLHPEVRYVTLTAAIENNTQLEIITTSSYTATYEVYNSGGNLLNSGSVNGTLSMEPFAFFDNTGVQEYEMVTWHLPESAPLPGDGAYIDFAFEVHCEAIGQTTIVLFPRATEDHGSPVSDFANLWIKDGKWYPLHNSYDPWDDDIQMGHSFNFYWWRRHTTTAFAKAWYNVTQVSPPPQPPVAHFTESATTIYTGEVISFNASESYDPDGGSIVSYDWSFGDGTNGSGMIVDHSYEDDGIFTVTLTVTDDENQTDTATATKTVMNRPPVALFTESAETVLTGEAIHFDASTSYDLDGAIVTYFWSFGDGSHATGMIVDHLYSDNGTYTVSLTVTDDDDATAQTSTLKTVENRPPTASFTETASSVLTNELIHFNASDSYDIDGSIVSYFWDFGDGNGAAGMLVSHSYVDNGTYTVSLTVTDDDGATDLVSAAKTVANRPPIPSFTESKTTGLTGEAIHFDASESYDLDGSIAVYFWDFGDGTNGTGVATDHSYLDDGVYTVTLTVTDDDNATATITATKSIMNRPPMALFTESAESVPTGELITFDASDSYDLDGFIVSFVWDFGDGNHADGMVVDHAYADDGTYLVTLTVTDDDDATDEASSTKTILNRPPSALFTESAETVYTGEVITFDAVDSYDVDGVITGYLWDFGDGSSATGVLTAHAYSDDGTYTVTLTVTDNDGATDTETAVKTILNRSPTALFTETAENVLTDEAIHFDASTSYDLDGYIATYSWDFGDGTVAIGVTVEHSYADEGTYEVTLTVTDDNGASTSAAATKNVGNRPPVAIFTESSETVFTGEAITFDAADSYDSDGTIVTYSWDFGDGSSAAGVVVNHIYPNNGTYTVTLTVTDDDQASSSTSSHKTVLNKPPIVLFTESEETAYTGELISFDASDSYDPDGSIVSYFWDFGDGTNAAGTSANHAYVDDGNYLVTLTVTDEDGATASTSATKTILNRPPTALFTESTDTAYTGEVITFNASDSYDPDGSIIEYLWDFGDGATAIGALAAHAYTDDGTYTVTLTVTDDDGATDTASASKTIMNRPPTALFTESTETTLTGESISFNAGDSYDLDGTIVLFHWNFGDGTSATGVSVDHSYADDGIYTVILTVTDNDGAVASADSAKTVLNRPPSPVFTESVETAYTGEIITFDASASNDLDGYIASYLWDFGDGTYTTGLTTSHSYVDNEVYTVTLTVTDDDGATASTSATKTILNRPPVVVFSESAETVAVGEAISFNAGDSYDLDGSIVTYSWDFGDGSQATGVTVEYAFADNGVYLVTLTVVDDDGATASAFASKTVEITPPVASFTESAETVYTGEIITFDAFESYDPDGYIGSYLWEFGDGSNAAGMTVGHSYANDGTYTVTLVVTDDDGATDSMSATKTVLNRPPVAVFIESAESVETGVLIHFDASSSYDLDGVIANYLWDFGDGSTATGMTVDHAYSDDDTYTVSLTVTDDDDATDSTSSVKTALNRPPVNIITWSPTTVIAGQSATFDATDTYDPDGTIVEVAWDFESDDRIDAYGTIVSHTYTTAGTYEVTMIATDDDGAQCVTWIIIEILSGEFEHHTIGYWRNHPDEWVGISPDDPFPWTTGSVTGFTYMEILNSKPAGDSSIQLARQYIAAKLNQFAYGVPQSIAETITDAEAFMAGHPPGSRPRGEDKKHAVELAGILENYNSDGIVQSSGIILPTLSFGAGLLSLLLLPWLRRNLFLRNVAGRAVTTTTAATKGREERSKCKRVVPHFSYGLSIQQRTPLLLR